MTVSSTGPMSGQYVFPMSKSRNCMHFVYSVAISNDSAFYFIEIIVLNSWIGTQTQMRMGVSSIIFHAMRPMRVKYIFLMPIS